MSKVLLGYRTISGVPRCPCADTGYHMAVEQPGDDPLEFVLRCWCGRTNRGRFDDLTERAEFIKRHGGAPDA